MDTLMIEIEGLPEERFEKGDVILEEGKKGDRVYILKDGSVRVTASGNELCRVNTPGTIFGEISALLDGDYSATVSAEQQTSFYIVDDLYELFRTNPEICMNVARLLALRLMNMNHLFAEFKLEIEKLQTDTSTKHASSKLFKLVQKMDEFWGRDVLDPFRRKGSR